MADYSTQTLGSVDMGLKVSQEVLEKIYAKVAYHKGYMISDRYTADAQSSLSILIPKFGRPNASFKSLSAVSHNPFSYASSGVTQTFDTLTVDMQLNDMIKVSEEQILQNVVGDKVIGTMTKMVSDVVGEQINIHTARGMINGSLAYNSIKKITDRKIAYVDVNSNTTSIPDYMVDLKAKINNADLTLGDSSFNDYKISQVISNTLEAYLLRTKNQFILESSYGQEILVEGDFGKITLNDLQAYRGRILGVDTFVLPDAFFPYAGNTNFVFNGVDYNPTAGKIYGLMAVPIATERVFVDRGVKVVEAQDFRGWLLQPLYRLGIKTVRPHGIGIIASSTYVDTNLAAELGSMTVSATTGAATTDIETFTSDVTVATYKGKVGSYVPYYLETAPTSGWTAITLSTTALTATEGQVITVLGINAGGKVVAYAQHTVAATDIGTSGQ